MHAIVLCLILALALFSVNATLYTVESGADLSQTLNNAQTDDQFVLVDGGIYSISSSITISVNIQLTSNTSAVIGCNGNNGFTVADGVQFTVASIVFENCNYAINHPYSTGLISINNCNFSSSSCFFTSSASISNCYFTNNIVSSSNGGALNIGGDGSFTISNCIFQNNTASGRGGAIYSTINNNNNNIVNIVDCTFLFNSATDGGAIYSSGLINLLNCDINNNSAQESGGGVYCADGYCSLYNSRLLYNNAGDGGGLYSESTTGSTTEITSSTISYNTAQASAGIYCSAGNLTITSSTISFNSATNVGGGIQSASTLFVIQDSNVLSNNAASGGGIWIAVQGSNQKAYILSTNVKNNVATDSGGGVYYLSPAIIYESFIDDNTATNNGGGMAVIETYVEIHNTSVSRNAASSGAGVYITGTQTSLIANSTIADNTISSAIYFASTEPIMRDTQLQTISDGTQYCCSGSATSTPNGAICSYPVCSGCIEATGCQCPFSYSTDIGPYPILPSANYTCTCTANYFPEGYYCRESHCVGVTNCSEHASCVDTDESFQCVCGAGFSGDGYTCTDICSTGLCSSGYECVNNYDGTYNCNDIDECAADNLNDCSSKNAHCVNTVGSFDCICNDGFKKDATGTTCIDIDECMDAAENNCTSPQFTCVNTDGSFYCVCSIGFQGSDCADIDECTTNTHNCSLYPHTTCSNTIGGFDCLCNSGYEGVQDNCTDINECFGANNCTSSESICINTEGSYYCNCTTGFEGDGYNCIDIDECSLHTDECYLYPNSYCSNTFGSYVCLCVSGYELDGLNNCIDIDECSSGSSNCSTIGSTCTNTIGSFYCNCSQGFQGDGYNCADINECEVANNCSSLATCNNTIGSYFCTCFKGYGNDDKGYNCTDLDECDLGTDDCDINSDCTNFIGGFNCTCHSGFIGNGAQCRASYNNCTQNGGCDYHTYCNTANGSRACSDCPEGYTGDPYVICEALCGDGVCDPDIGEDCVTCPADCTDHCATCGNLVCETGETCAEDCFGALSCTDGCSGNGKCNDGICACDDPWGGPSCSQSNNAFSAALQTAQPGVLLTSTQTGIAFSITIKEIRELDENGGLITSYSLAGRTYTPYSRSFQNTSTATPGYCSTCEVVDYVRLVEGGGATNKIWIANVTLENRAYIEIGIWEFLEPSTTILFAEQEYVFGPNNVQIAYQIRDWPFKSIQSSLEIVMTSSSQSFDPCGNVAENTQIVSDMFRWFTIYLGGITLYGQFLNRVVIDGLTRLIGLNFNPDTLEVVAKLPHFFYNSIVESSFSMQAGRNGQIAECEFSARAKPFPTVIVATVVPIVVTFVAFILLLVLSKTVRNWFAVQFAIQEITSEQIRKEVEMEKIQEHASKYRHSVRIRR